MYLINGFDQNNNIKIAKSSFISKSISTSHKYKRYTILFSYEIIPRTRLGIEFNLYLCIQCTIFEGKLFLSNL